MPTRTVSYSLSLFASPATALHGGGLPLRAGACKGAGGCCGAEDGAGGGYREAEPAVWADGEVKECYSIVDCLGRMSVWLMKYARVFVSRPASFLQPAITV